MALLVVGVSKPTISPPGSSLFGCCYWYVSGFYIPVSFLVISRITPKP